MSDGPNTIKLFESQQIRSEWDAEAEKWWFSIVDVVATLTESVDATAYWRKLKQRLKAEGNETVTNCHGLKMRAADGKLRMTDVANTEQLLRLTEFEILNKQQRIESDFDRAVKKLLQKKGAEE